MALYKVTKKQSGNSAPKLLSAQSRNISSIGSLSYTFTESGTFQYYGFISKSNAVASTDITVTLNGVAITPTFYITSTLGWYYGEITVSANDVLAVANTVSMSNYPLQLFVLQNADISNFSMVGQYGNDGNTFTLNTGDSFYLNVFQCGYWGSTVNNFNYEIGIYGNRSVATPNQSQYYYGFTYVITI